MGKTRQLEAGGGLCPRHPGGQTVTWTTDNPKVATVTQKGLVTAVSEGTAEIVAPVQGGQQERHAGDGDPSAHRPPRRGVPLPMMSSPCPPPPCTTSGGQYVDTVLKAPVVTIRSGATDVTGRLHPLLPLDRQRPEGAGHPGHPADPSLADPVGPDGDLYRHRHQQDRQHPGAHRSCRYGVKRSTRYHRGGRPALKGSVTLDKPHGSGGQAVYPGSAAPGDGDSLLTPAIPGLTHVVFDMNSVTGAAVGTLSARGGGVLSQPGGRRESPGRHCPSPPQAGTYGINFPAYGDQAHGLGWKWWSAGQAVEPDGEDIPCDCTGYTFTGSDFFHSRDADPVAAVFGKPRRASCCGTGPWQRGGRRRAPLLHPTPPATASTMFSTLSYLPNAGFSGRVTLPVTLITQSGKQVEDTLSFYVTSKTHSEQFTDVTETTVGLWAADAVDFAYHFGLVSGGGGDQVRPQLPHDPGPAGDGSVPGSGQPRGDGHHQL